LIHFAEPPRTLVVHVVNTSNVPRDVVAWAGKEVQRIYQKAGIPIVWSLDPAVNETNGFQVTVVITARCINRQICRDKSVMGTALGSDRDGIPRAYVFSDHVYEMAVKFHKRAPVPRPEALVLGHAIAHEVGHLLLPPPGHTNSGLMAPRMDLPAIRDAVRGDLLFTREQSEHMRGTLSR